MPLARVEVAENPTVGPVRFQHRPVEAAVDRQRDAPGSAPAGGIDCDRAGPGVPFNASCSNARSCSLETTTPTGSGCTSSVGRCCSAACTGWAPSDSCGRSCSVTDSAMPRWPSCSSSAVTAASASARASANSQSLTCRCSSRIVRRQPIDQLGQPGRVRLVHGRHQRSPDLMAASAICRATSGYSVFAGPRHGDRTVATASCRPPVESSGISNRRRHRG